MSQILYRYISICRRHLIFLLISSRNTTILSLFPKGSFHVKMSLRIENLRMIESPLPISPSISSIVPPIHHQINLLMNPDDFFTLLQLPQGRAYIPVPMLMKIPHTTSSLRVVVFPDVAVPRASAVACGFPSPRRILPSFVDISVESGPKA